MTHPVPQADRAARRLTRSVRWWLALALAVGGRAQAQASGNGATAYRIAGAAVASAYNFQALSALSPVPAPGTYTIRLSNCRPAIVGGHRINPLAAGSQVMVDDPQDGSEKVTVTAQLVVGQSCQITATFAHAHSLPYSISSANSGLNEAIQDLGVAGGTVIVDPGWAGSAADIAAARGNSSVSLVDERAGETVWYEWNSSKYVAMLSTNAGGASVVARGPWLDPRAFGAACDGDTDDSAALQRWLNAVVASHGTGVVPNLTCAFSVPLVVPAGSNNWSLRGLSPTATLRYDGTAPVTAALWVQGSSSSLNYVISLSALSIQGDSASSYDLECDSCERSDFSDLHLRDTLTAGLYLKWGVGDVLSGVSVSSNETGGRWEYQQPASCMIFDRQPGTGDWTSGSSLLDPVCEGVSGAGLQFISGRQIGIFGAQISGAAIGITIGPDSQQIDVQSGVIEAGVAVQDQGGSNVFSDVDYSGGIHLMAGANQDLIMGGIGSSITIDSAVLNTIVEGTTSGCQGPTISDNGVNTAYLNVINCNGQSPLPFWRQTIPEYGTASGLNLPAQDLLRGAWKFTGIPSVLSTTLVAPTVHWRLLFLGVWLNDDQKDAFAQPGGVVELTDGASSVAAGDDTLTVSVSTAGKFQAAVTAGTSAIYFVGTILAMPREASTGGASLLLQGTVSAAGFATQGGVPITDTAAVVEQIGTLTTTAAGSDTIEVASLSPGAHCGYAATNAIAAGLSGIYITVGSGSLTLYHNPTAGATFNLFCAGD